MKKICLNQLKELFESIVKIDIKKLEIINKNFKHLKMTYLISGAPGIGKTQILGQIVNKINDEFGRKIKLHSNRIYQEGDVIAGLPNLEHNELNWATPEWFRNIKEDLQDGFEVVVLLDDLHLLNKFQLVSMYEFFETQTLNGKKLGENIKVIAIGNFNVDLSLKCIIDSPIMNRLLGYYELTPKASEITQYFIEGCKSNYKNINHVIANFISAYPKYCYTPAPEAGIMFPSPRSWEHFALSYEIAEGNIDDLICDPMAILGEDCGRDFKLSYEFLNYSDDELEKFDDNISKNVFKAFVLVGKINDKRLLIDKLKMLKNKLNRESFILIIRNLTYSKKIGVTDIVVNFKDLIEDLKNYFKI